MSARFALWSPLGRSQLSESTGTSWPTGAAAFYERGRPFMKSWTALCRWNVRRNAHTEQHYTPREIYIQCPLPREFSRRYRTGTGSFAHSPRSSNRAIKGREKMELRTFYGGTTDFIMRLDSELSQKSKRQFSTLKLQRISHLRAVYNFSFSRCKWQVRDIYFENVN